MMGTSVVGSMLVSILVSGGGGIGGDKSGGGGSGDDGNERGGGGEEESDGKRNTPLSMSQKLTLGYAFLVGGTTQRFTEPHHMFRGIYKTLVTLIQFNAIVVFGFLCVYMTVIALVGGLMGYLKSGSQKSLLAGGLSAAVLLYVFCELPTKPVLASTIGVVLAGALTWVMGTRYMGSKKIFPAGVVSFVSFIMTGGYIHGIMRSLH